MAKRRKSAKTIVRTVTAKAPSPTIRIAAPAAITRARKAGRKHYRKARAGVGKFLGASQPQLTAIAGAAALGLAQKQGIKVPKLIDSLSVPANAGIIAFALGKFFKSSTLDHMATGALCVATWGWASESKIDGDVMGVYGTGVVYGDDYTEGYYEE